MQEISFVKYIQRIAQTLLYMILSLKNQNTDSLHSPILPNLDVSEADNSNEPYLPYYQYLLSKPNSELPNVITNSYGDDEQVLFHIT